MITRDDSFFIAFTDLPEKSADKYLQRVRLNAENKFTIIPCLRDVALAKTREAIDKNVAAHQSRTQLEKISNLCSAEFVAIRQV